MSQDFREVRPWQNKEGIAPAIILARGGSVGIPNKNLQKIQGLSLLARMVLAARMARQITQVYVSTDNQDIAQEAQNFGARVIQRPAALCTPHASSEAGWLHALQELRALGHAQDFAVFLQCTSPFTTGRDIDKSLEILQGGAWGSVFSAIPDHGFLWGMDANGATQGITHETHAPRQRRQDSPPRFRESGAIYAVRWHDFESQKQRFCGATTLFAVTHPMLEIDTPNDLDQARALAPLYDRSQQMDNRLSQIKAVIFDFDGVMTDNTALIDADGKESVRISRADGMGVAKLKAQGHVALLILSSEINAVIHKRAEKLGIEAQNGIKEKGSALTSWLEKRQIEPKEALFIGNDINDLSAFDIVGLTACPCDAVPQVLARADWVLPARGGAGAVRHLCDRLCACHS